jgi:polyphenol oxidase
LENNGIIWTNDQDLLVAFSSKKPELFKEDPVPGINVGMKTADSEERVWEKRSFFLNTLGLDRDQVVFANQVHGSEIHYAETPGIIEGVDGFVTRKRNLALAIQVADCAAVFIADRVNGVIGAAHSGWKGAAGNIIPKMIGKMMAEGASIPDMDCWVSPCIGTSRFEVGEEVAQLFPGNFVIRNGTEKPHIDLKGVVRSQLIESGLLGDRIYIDPGCTYDETDLYYSYRREKEKSGRMMGIIMLK